MTTIFQRGPFLVRETIGEIVGYFGAAVGLTAASIALGGSATPNVQLIFNLVTGAALFGAGLALGGAAGAYARMRSVFWFLSVFLIAGMVSILLGPNLGLSARTVVVLTGLISAAYSFALWWMSRRSLQVLALILSLLVTVIALIFPNLTGLFGPPSFTGVALVTWLFGGVVIAAGALGVLTPRRTTLAVGSVIAVLGPLFLLSSDTQILGEALSLLTAVALLATGAWFGELGMTGIGIAGILLASSAIVANHVREQGSAIAVLVVGLVMVGVAIVLARTVSEPTAPPVTTSPPPDAPPGL
jgi:hypothetical protein